MNTEHKQEKLSKIKNSIFAVLPPALLIILNIFVFGPTTIYEGNISEFRVGLVDILPIYIIPSLLLLLILLGTGLLFSKKYLDRYVAVIFALGLLIWIQGNIFVWDYGPFAGQDIDWAKNIWRGWIDGSLWILLLILSFLLYKRIHRIITFSSIILISLQIGFLGFMSYQKPEIWKTKAFRSGYAPKWTSEFSSKN